MLPESNDAEAEVKFGTCCWAMIIIFPAHFVPNDIISCNRTKCKFQECQHETLKLV
jgi:hypothetical protein